MHVVIDPRVLCNENYAHSLVPLEQSKASYCFIVTGFLKQRYIECSESVSLRSVAQLARSIAFHLVNGTAFKRLVLELQSNHPLPSALAELVSTCKFDETDQHLLQVAIERCNATTTTEVGPALVLLISCNGPDGNRCLHQEQFRDTLCQAVAGLRVHCAEDKNPISQHVVDPKNLTNEQQHDTHFEDQCALWLGRKLNCGCSTKVKMWGHEIDILCEVTGTHYYVGECKLVRGGADAAQARQKEALQQLKDRVVSGRKQSGSATQLECYVFCNEDFGEEIRTQTQSVAQELGVKIHLICVKMPANWNKKPDWRLGDQNCKEVYCAG